MEELYESSSDITLDQIDTYLSRNNYLASLNAHKKLWNKDEYYEFNVITNRVPEDLVCLDKLSNMNKHKCHICNIDVPRAYMKDHYNSVKHKTYLKITDLALERTRLHLKHQNEVPNLQIQLKKTYFCEPCAAVVEVVKKSEHEISRTHCISVKHDKLLQDLFQIYTDRNNINDDFKHENSLEIDMKNDYKIEARLDNVKEEVSNKINLEPNDVNNCLQAYLDSLNRIKKGPPVHSLAVVKYNCIEITALNGSKVAVPADHFHGYKKASDHTQCLLCKVLIDEDIETHKFTETHMNRVMLPIRDEHFVREIDEWNHCILCNDLFFDVDLHIQSDKHKCIMEEAKENLKPEKRKSIELLLNLNSKENKLNGKEVTIGSNFNVTAQNSLESVHKIVHDTNCRKKETIALSHAKDVEQILQENIHYHMSKTANSNEYNCNVCKIKISFKNIEEHVKGSRHNVNFNEFLSLNKIKLIDNEFRCEICSVFISKLNIFDHINTKNHMLLLKQRVSQITAAASSSKAINVPTPNTGKVLIPNEDYCNICKVKVPLNGMKIHNNGRPHKNKVLEMSKMQLESAKVNVQSSTKMSAQTPPNVNAQPLPKVNAPQPPAKKNMQPLPKVNAPQPSAKQNVQPPPKMNAQPPAKKNVQLPVKVNVQPPTKVDLQPPDKVNVQGPAILSHYLMQNTDKPNSFLCTVCNVHVPKTPGNITEHVKGMNHVMNYNEIISKNKLIKRGHMRYYCAYCESDIENQEEIAHVNDITHKILVSFSRVDLEALATCLRK